MTFDARHNWNRAQTNIVAEMLAAMSLPIQKTSSNLLAFCSLLHLALLVPPAQAVAIRPVTFLNGVPTASSVIENPVAGQALWDTRMALDRSKVNMLVRDVFCPMSASGCLSSSARLASTLLFTATVRLSPASRLCDLPLTSQTRRPGRFVNHSGVTYTSFLEERRWLTCCRHSSVALTPILLSLAISFQNWHLVTPGPQRQQTLRPTSLPFFRPLTSIGLLCCPPCARFPVPPALRSCLCHTILMCWPFFTRTNTWNCLVWPPGMNYWLRCAGWGNKTEMATASPTNHIAIVAHGHRKDSSDSSHHPFFKFGDRTMGTCLTSKILIIWFTLQVPPITFPPLSTRLLCLVVVIPLMCWLYMCTCVCVPLLCRENM